jgi:hypothetical protein
MIWATPDRQSYFFKLASGAALKASELADEHNALFGARTSEGVSVGAKQPSEDLSFDSASKIARLNQYHQKSQVRQGMASRSKNLRARL